MIRDLPLPASRTSWLADVPVDLGRDEAQDLARRELADPSYDAEPSLLQRAVEWLFEQLAELLSRTTGALSGWVGLAVLGGLAALVAVVVVLRVGPLASRAASGKAVFSGSRRSAAEYRADADDASARGDWSAAVVERYRAVVAGMEERGVLDPRPGRTADEAAAAGGSILPGVAGDLTTGSRVFDGVRYGDRAATSGDDAAMRRLDEAVRTARPGHAAEPAASAAPVPT